MAERFNIVAQLQIQGPVGARAVARNLQRQFKGIRANVDVRVNRRAARSVTTLTRGLQRLNNVLSQVRTNAAAVNQQLSNISALNQNITSSQSKAANATQKTTKAVQDTDKATKAALNSVETFGRQARLAAQRFIAFTTATSILVGLVVKIREATIAGIEFQREVVRLSQVTNTSITSLRGLTNEITRLATGFGVSSEELIQVARVLTQAGLAANETSQALEALAKSSLAPTFNEMGQTVEGVVAIMNQFEIQAGEVESALGSINAVAGQFAVESEDIIAAVRRTGGAFRAAGGNFNELVALFASVRQTTRESAESIATGFRTIFTRIQRASTLDQLRELGIVLEDTEDRFVGPFEAVKRLNEALGQLPAGDRRLSQIIEELGGFRQVSKVIPLVQQFATAQEALQVAQRGTNSLTADATKAQEAFLVQLTKVQERLLALFRTFGENTFIQAFGELLLRSADAAITLAENLEPLIPIISSFALIKISQGTGGFLRGFLSSSGGGAPATGPPTGTTNQIGQNLGGAVSGRNRQQQVLALQQNTQALTALSTTIGAQNSVINNLAVALRILQGGLQPLPAALQAARAAITSLITSISQLQFRQRPGFASGGMVPGVGSGDTVPANLTPGEFVIKKSSVQKIGVDNLAAINQEPQRFQTGGEVKVTLPRQTNIGQLALFDDNKSKAGTVESKLSSIPPSARKAFFRKTRADSSDPVISAGVSGIRLAAPVTNSVVTDDKFSQSFRRETANNVFSAINKSANKFAVGRTKFDIERDSRLASIIEGIVFEGALSALGNIVNRGGIVAFDFKASNAAANRLSKLSEPKVRPGFVDAKRTIVPRSDIVRKAAGEGLFDNKFNKSLLSKVREIGKERFEQQQLRTIEKGRTAERRLRSITRAGGGSIPGSGNRDTVPALLTPGEFVLRKEAVQGIGLANARKLNEGRVKFSDGGLVSALRNRNKNALVSELVSEGASEVSARRAANRALRGSIPGGLSGLRQAAGISTQTQERRQTQAVEGGEVSITAGSVNLASPSFAGLFLQGAGGRQQASLTAQVGTLSNDTQAALVQAARNRGFNVGRRSRVKAFSQFGFIDPTSSEEFEQAAEVEFASATQSLVSRFNPFGDSPGVSRETLRASNLDGVVGSLFQSFTTALSNAVPGGSRDAFDLPSVGRNRDRLSRLFGDIPGSVLAAEVKRTLTDDARKSIIRKAANLAADGAVSLTFEGVGGPQDRRRVEPSVGQPLRRRFQSGGLVTTQRELERIGISGIDVSGLSGGIRTVSDIGLAQGQSASPGTQGQTNVGTGEILLREGAGIDTAFHELVHNLDKVVFETFAARDPQFSRRPPGQRFASLIPGSPFNNVAKKGKAVLAQKFKTPQAFRRLYPRGESVLLEGIANAAQAFAIFKSVQAGRGQLTPLGQRIIAAGRPIFSDIENKVIPLARRISKSRAGRRQFNPRATRIRNPSTLRNTRFAEGGEVPALLEPGEFVIRKEAASRIGNERLNRLNEEPQRFHQGGPVKMQRGGQVGQRGGIFSADNAIGLSLLAGFITQIVSAETAIGQFAQQATSIIATLGILRQVMQSAAAAGKEFAQSQRGPRGGGRSIRTGLVAARNVNKRLEGVGLTAQRAQIGMAALSAALVTFGSNISQAGEKALERAKTESEIQSALQQRRAGGALQAAGIGAGTGAAIGSVFGPVGTLAGGAIGAAIGALASTISDDSEIEAAKRRLAISIEDIGTDLENVAKGRATPFSAADEIGRTIRQVLSARSSANPEIQAAAEDQAQQLLPRVEDFAKKLAESSSTFEQFQTTGNNAGRSIINFISTLRGSRIETVSKLYRDQIAAQNNAIALQNALNQSTLALTRELQAARDVANSFSSLDRQFNNLQASIENTSSFFGDNATAANISSQAGLIGDLGTNVDLRTFSNAVNEIGRNIDALGGGGRGRTLAEEAVGAERVLQDLPDILRRAVATPLAPNQGISDVVGEQLDNVPAEIRNVILDNIRNAIGTGDRGPAGFIDKVEENAEAVAGELGKNFEPIIEALRQSGTSINAQSQRLQQIAVQRAQVEQQILDLTVESLNLQKEAAERQRDILGSTRPRSINQNLQGFFDQLQARLNSVIGANTQANLPFIAGPTDVQGISQALSAVRERFNEVDAALQDNPLSTGLNQEFQDLQSQGRNLRQVLQDLTRTGQEAAQAAKEELEAERQALGVRENLADVLIGGNVDKINERGRDIQALTVLQQSGFSAAGLEKLDDLGLGDVRERIPQLLEQIGSARLEFLGGASGTEALRQLRASVAGEAGLSRDTQRDLATGTTARQRELAEDVAGFDRLAQEAFQAIQQAAQTRSDELATTLENTNRQFLSELKNLLLESQISRGERETEDLTRNRQGIESSIEKLSGIQQQGGQILTGAQVGAIDTLAPDIERLQSIREEAAATATLLSQGERGIDRDAVSAGIDRAVEEESFFDSRSDALAGLSRRIVEQLGTGEERRRLEARGIDANELFNRIESVLSSRLEENVTAGVGSLEGVRDIAIEQTPQAVRDAIAQLVGDLQSRGGDISTNIDEALRDIPARLRENLILGNIDPSQIGEASGIVREDETIGQALIRLREALSETSERERSSRQRTEELRREQTRPVSRAADFDVPIETIRQPRQRTTVPQVTFDEGRSIERFNSVIERFGQQGFQSLGRAQANENAVLRFDEAGMGRAENAVLRFDEAGIAIDRQGFQSLGRAQAGPPGRDIEQLGRAGTGVVGPAFENAVVRFDEAGIAIDRSAQSFIQGNVSFEQSVSKLQDGLALFAERVDLLAEALQGIPEQISLTNGGEINVVLNGAQVLQQLLPALRQQVASAISEELENRFGDATAGIA